MGTSCTSLAHLYRIDELRSLSLAREKTRTNVNGLDTYSELMTSDALGELEGSRRMQQADVMATILKVYPKVEFVDA